MSGQLQHIAGAEMPYSSTAGGAELAVHARASRALQPNVITLLSSHVGQQPPNVRIAACAAAGATATAAADAAGRCGWCGGVHGCHHGCNHMHSQHNGEPLVVRSAITQFCTVNHVMHE